VQPGDLLLMVVTHILLIPCAGLLIYRAKTCILPAWAFSGGEEGARKGPSIMPGGDAEAYPHIKPMLEAVSAR